MKTAQTLLYLALAWLAAVEGLNTRADTFRVYWNVPSFGCNRHGIFINVSAPFGIVQNAADSFRGEEITILYDPGLFPTLIDNSGSGQQKRNGGVPQEGNLTLHIQALAKDVDRLVSDNFSGLGVLDMESWRPIWRQLFGSFKKIKDYSMAVERQRHPTMRTSALEQEAKRRFEKAARNFMQTSLELVRQMRPQARWGYYAFPYCFNYNQASCPGNVQVENNNLQWLFDESEALFPSLYLGENSPPLGIRAKFMRGRLAEAKRLAARAPRLQGPRVYAYIRYNYHDTGNFLSQDDLYNSIAVPKEMDVNGVVIWGSWNDVSTKAKCQALQNFVNTRLRPTVRNVTDTNNIP